MKQIFSSESSLPQRAIFVYGRGEHLDGKLPWWRYLGADLGTVVKRAVDGIVEAAAETGEDVSKIVKQSAEGAIEEAEHVSNMAVGAVKEVLAGIRGGTAEAAQTHAQHGATDRHSRHEPRHTTH